MNQPKLTKLAIAFLAAATALTEELIEAIQNERLSPDYEDETPAAVIEIEGLGNYELYAADAFELDTLDQEFEIVDAFDSPLDIVLSSRGTVEPEYKLTEKAAGFTLDDFIKQGWTNELLIEQGYMVAIPLAPVVPAAPSPAVALPSPPAPMVPPPSTPIAPPIAAQAAIVKGAVDLDTEGMPWDTRIHSGERTKIANGTWKVKRGTPADLVAQVKAQLKTLPVNSAAPGGAMPQTVTGCAALMRRVTTAIKSGQFTQADMLKAVNKHGIADIKDLQLPQNTIKLPLIEFELFSTVTK